MVPGPGTGIDPRTPQNFSRAGDGEIVAMDERAGFLHASFAKPRVFDATFGCSSYWWREQEWKKKATVGNHGGPLRGNFRGYLTAFAPAQKCWNSGDKTGTTNTKNRKQSGHFRNRNGHSANIVDLRSRIWTGTASGFRGKVGGRELIRAGDDRELSEQSRPVDRCRAGIGPGQVQNRRIVGRCHQRGVCAHER